MRAHRALALSTVFLAAQASALEVWTNQVGFDTAAPKRFRVVAPTDYGQVPATFEVVDAAGAVKQSGQAAYSGAQWGEHFWSGDASALTAPGTYRVRAHLGADTAESYGFTVGDGAPIRAAARAMVEFFFVQRCGYAVPGWHAACHLDDAKTPDGGSGDFTGGWHDSGEYQKYAGGFHPWATQALLEAYERRQAVFDGVDVLVPNGVPDILEEALWGAAFEMRMSEPDGHLWEYVAKVRSGKSGVIPEDDTDGVKNTSDDREVRGSPDPNSHATLIAANLARLHRLLTARGGQPPPDPLWLPRAEAIWAYYLPYGYGGLPYGPLDEILLAALELYQATGAPQYATAADAVANQLGQAFISDSSSQDSDFVGSGRGPAALAVYLEHFPSGNAAAVARQGMVAVLDHWWQDMYSDTVGLVRRSYYGTPVFFVGPPVAPDGWLRLGQNSGIGYTAYAASLGAALTGDARYAQMAADQVDWVLGSNPQRWCMVQGIGHENPKGYHHYYAYVVGHLDGAVPGAVVNGYARDANALSVDAPWIDTTTNFEISIPPFYRDVTVTSYVTNEPWLPNNAGVLLALASAPFTPTAPAADGGVDAGTTVGSDAGADAGQGADGGQSADAGAKADAGVFVDAGDPPPAADAGPSDAGAAAPTDGGPNARTQPPSCGCTAAESPALLAAMLLALAFRRVTGPRERPCPESRDSTTARRGRGAPGWDRSRRAQAQRSARSG